MGCVQLQNTLSLRYVVSHLHKRYREWKEQSGGWGLAPPMEWGYAKCLLHRYILGYSISMISWAWRVARHQCEPIVVKSGCSSSAT